MVVPTAGPRHVLDARMFDAELLDELFALAHHIKTNNGDPPKFYRDRLQNLLAYSLFYEASTRTRTSFETAAYRLGLHVISSENAGEFSSRAKGESDLDAFRVFASYGPDVIWVRHDKTDELTAIAARLDAEGYRVPILNAGDGKGQHPTQGLLDMLTILEELERLHGLKVGMVGDLKNGRTARTVAYLLAKYPGNELLFVAPDEVQMEPDILEYLDRHSVKYGFTDDLDYAMGWADVVYDTRIQAERGMDQAAYDRVAGRFAITPREMALLQPHAIVMHPLPRVEPGTTQKVKLSDENGEWEVNIRLVPELSHECDGNPQLAIFRQAANGRWVRMALLCWVLCGFEPIVRR